MNELYNTTKPIEILTVVSFVLVWIIVWWLILFMILPFGVQPDENAVGGNMKAAPKNPHLRIKFFVTTLISCLVTYIGFYLVGHGYFDFLNLQNAIQ